MQLVLHYFEELECFRHGCVIVRTGSVKIKYLAIHHLFAGADVADALDELLPVKPAAHVLQEFVVHGEALGEIFARHAGRLTPELRAAWRFNPIADRNDSVEVVEGDRFVGISNAQKLHIAFFIKLSL